MMLSMCCDCVGVGVRSAESRRWLYLANLATTLLQPITLKNVPTATSTIPSL